MPSRDRATFLLRDQGRYCADMGSPLYAYLFERAAEDVAGGGPVFDVLEPFDAPSFRADALALRLMAAVHRLVLTGSAPRLALHYPSAGGSATRDGAWPAFRDVIVDHREHLRSLVALPCQTNEVGRGERRGCDPLPVDPKTPDGRLTLESSVWADQVDRLRRLRGAFEVAVREPATVDATSVESWLPQRLAERRPGVATVVFHSIVDEYLTPSARLALHGSLAETGAAATPDAPLAWVRLEPTPATRGYAVTLTAWPGGDERVVATSGAHGSEVRTSAASRE